MKTWIASLLALLVAGPSSSSAFAGSGNDTCATATVLTAGTHAGFHLSDHWYFDPISHVVMWNTDFDLYRITVPPGDQLTVQMNITHVDGAYDSLQNMLWETDATTCPDPMIPSLSHWSVVNAGSVAKDYLLGTSALSALPQMNMDLDYDLVVQLTPGTVAEYCPGAVNSLGVSSHLHMLEVPSLSVPAWWFYATGMHGGTPGQLFCGTTHVQVPFGDGMRCVGGAVRRLELANTLPSTPLAGSWGWVPDHAALMALLSLAPGTTYDFQLLYRDLNGPLNTGFNLSNALEVTFLP